MKFFHMLHMCNLTLFLFAIKWHASYPSICRECHVYNNSEVSVCLYVRAPGQQESLPCAVTASPVGTAVRQGGEARGSALI